MKSFLLTCSLILTLHFAQQDLHAQIFWIQGPQVSKESVMRVHWLKNGSPIEPSGNFEVSLWMPNMNHGSAPTQIQRVLDSNDEPLVGVYDIYNVYFLMSGAWKINFVLTDENTISETQSLDITL